VGHPGVPTVTIRRARPLLGTLVEIQVEACDAAGAHRAIDAAFGEIAAVHRLMSFHEAGSDVTRYNRARPGEAVRIDARTAEVLACAESLQRESDGAFDIGIAATLVALGLLPAPPEAAGSAPVEGAATTCTVVRGDATIDLGGIAKGYAVDRAIDALARCGIAAALVNAGGDLRHLGVTPVEIVLRDPADPSRLSAAVELTGRALASSATRGLALAQGLTDATASAVIDRRDGAGARPLRLGTGVSVVAPTCMLADALTKVVLVTGRRDHPVLASHDARVLVYRAAPESGP
jgi:thiamine biosynthesis lipoprotein